jgi:parvulin-like peptidyl-prolyl isomerase
LEANLYTTLQFRVALKSQILASRITEAIAGLAPTTAEHIHARHILVATESEAQDLLAQVQQGADFAILALTYSLDLSTRAAGGDLGWFPRGLLTAPEAEEAAFGLQPDEISGVIRSSMGFHIIQSLGRDPDRELSPEALQLYRTRTVEAWLAEQMAAAQIERMITP